ncbi:MAG TPA: hypothetical protein VHS05_03015 [Pyrinomonadaceae bacterium]|jgi:hypothetical protein|nr:hypothetical protein [Pyrinomonadaceae bacterium]
MKHLLPLIAVLAFVTVYANQQRVKISPGFFTGKDYLDMSDTEKRAYATGEINGMLVAPFFGAPEENLNWLKTCTGKLSDEQLATILTRFIRDQPDQMQVNLNVVTFNAMRDACRKLPN